MTHSQDPLDKLGTAECEVRPCADHDEGRKEPYIALLRRGGPNNGTISVTYGATTYYKAIQRQAGQRNITGRKVLWVLDRQGAMSRWPGGEKLVLITTTFPLQTNSYIGN